MPPSDWALCIALRSGKGAWELPEKKNRNHLALKDAPLAEHENEAVDTAMNGVVPTYHPSASERRQGPGAPGLPVRPPDVGEQRQVRLAALALHGHGVLREGPDEGQELNEWSRSTKRALEELKPNSRLGFLSETRICKRLYNVKLIKPITKNTVIVKGISGSLRKTFVVSESNWRASLGRSCRWRARTRPTT